VPAATTRDIGEGESTCHLKDSIAKCPPSMNGKNSARAVTAQTPMMRPALQAWPRRASYAAKIQTGGRN